MENPRDEEVSFNLNRENSSKSRRIGQTLLLQLRLILQEEARQIALCHRVSEVQGRCDAQCLWTDHGLFLLMFPVRHLNK